MSFFKKLVKNFWGWLGGGRRPASPPPSPSLLTPMPPASSGRPMARPATTVKPAASPPPPTVTVRAGETLFSLADRYNVTVQAIIQANHLASKRIYIGQKLILPEGASPEPTPAAPGFDRRVFKQKAPAPLPQKPDAAEPPASARPARVQPEGGPRQPAKGEPAPPPPAGPSTRLETRPEPGEASQLPTKSKPETAPTTAKPLLKPLPPVAPGQKRPQGAKPAPAPRPRLVSISPPPPSQTVSKPAPPPALPPAPDRSADRPVASEAQPPERAAVPPPPAEVSTPKPAPVWAEVREEPPPKPAPPPEPIVRHFPAEAVQGLYLAYHTSGNAYERARVLDLARSSRINALVIDLKNEGGHLSYRSRTSLAASLGASRPLVEDMSRLTAEFKAHGLYPIARLVAFKDNLLARAHPHLAARHPYRGDIWLDQQQNAWVDPFCQEVWDYLLDLAGDAARLGFAEIQFEALRFPTPGLNGAPQFSQALSPETRLNVISGFLSAARGLLAPAGVKIGASILGYACWREDDALVGQQIERLAPYLDVLSPLLYPSALAGGIPGCANPLDHPAEAVYQGVKRAVERVQACAPGCQVRPWLQDFQDYAFDRRLFSPADLRGMLSGAVEGGAAGFMAWNPQTEYSWEAYSISEE